jgi:hypothetical protein
MTNPAHRSRPPRTRTAVRALVLVATLLVPTGRARAEDGRGAHVFPELGMASFGIEEGSYTVAGLRVASLSPNQPSADFALAAWLVPAAVLTTDLSLAFPIGIGADVRLVPHIGGSAFLVAGGGIAGYGLGPCAGLGLVMNARGPVSVRVDGTLRRIGGDSLDEEDAVTMNSVTLGITW